MEPHELDEVIDRIVAQDPRYAREAYDFMREAVEFTQNAIRKANNNRPRHITGQELLAGIRTYALEQYGPMALMLFHEWGIYRCEDFGEIVFNLVDHGIFSKTESDRKEDFAGGYDFEEVFRKPFKPKQPAAGRPFPPGSTSF
ncbi:MAG: hypothetical protein D6766_04860 [Verrucomicrobia bacterium]|nr:MAG: hypothetical protein D6766_04860 [Verrucomicrobiota bacterium]